MSAFILDFSHSIQSHGGEKIEQKNSTDPIFFSSFEIDVVKGTKVVKRAAQFPANFEEPE